MPGSVPPGTPAGAASGWQPTGGRTAVRPMPSSTMMRASQAHTHPDVLGQGLRFCLSLGLTLVLAPPREHGPQNRNASCNPLWQQKVWLRLQHASAPTFPAPSDRFVGADQQRRARRDEQAPARRPFPKRWQLDLQKRPAARSFICAGGILPGRSGCWASVGKGTNCGLTAWCAPRWIWRPIKAAATGCAGRRRRTAPGQNFQIWVP